VQKTGINLFDASLIGFMCRSVENNERVPYNAVEF